MRALITGVTGFAGSFLAEHCLAQPGIEVVGLVRNSRAVDARRAVGRGHLAGGGGRARRRRAVDRAVAVVQPEIVFHLAAQSFVPQSFADPVGTLLDNAVGQLHVILAMLRHCPTARLLVVGSATEYGLVRPEENPVDEHVALRPTDPYAVSKVTQDLQAYQYFVSHRLPAVRVRAFNHTGPRQDEAFVASRFAREIARIEAGLAPPELTVGNLTAIREFTDVRDVVRAYFCAARARRTG